VTSRKVFLEGSYCNVTEEKVPSEGDVYERRARRKKGPAIATRNRSSGVEGNGGETSLLRRGRSVPHFKEKRKVFAKKELSSFWEEDRLLPRRKR